MQRLWKMTQPTDDWLPADDDAKQIVKQQQQQQRQTTMLTPRGPVADYRSVELTGFRIHPHDVTDDVTDHVTVEKDGGRINSAFDHRD